MRRVLVSILIVAGVLALGISVAGAHKSRIGTKVIGASSTTGHFYESGRQTGAYTSVVGFVRSTRVRCKGGRRVTATVVDTQTGDRRRVRNPALSEPDGKFGVEDFKYTPRFDRTIITVRRKFLRRTASHRHVCRTKRLTVPHRDLD